MHQFDFASGFFQLAVLVLLLGMRHGLAPDHLAAIDGLTRANAATRPRLARAAGLLFSLGHGAVVVAVAVAACLLATAWQPPGWALAFGAWASIALLVALAVANIAAVLRADSNSVPALVGWWASLLSRWFSAGSVPMVLTVGALFALSFDTLSQAALFAVMSVRHGGLQATVMLAACFVAGLLAVDAVNGIWISRLIGRADRTARVASRAMGLTVGALGLLTAALGVVVQLAPAAAAWGEGREAWFGVALIAIVFASFQLAMWLAARPSRQVAAEHVPVLQRG